jgi:hypothetical protein
MQARGMALLALAPLYAIAQSTCPQVEFLTARAVNLKPSLTTHSDAVRQADGSYTGFEATDAAPYAPSTRRPISSSSSRRACPAGGRETRLRCPFQ